MFKVQRQSSKIGAAVFIAGTLAISALPFVAYEKNLAPTSLGFAWAQSGGKIFNVKEHGARGDGIADDTAAVQAIINTAPKGSKIFFPSGTYIVANFEVKNRFGLTFAGQGRESILKRKSQASHLATFERASDILIEKLAFDANGITSFGGVRLYASRGVRIEGNRFFDSNPKPLGETDRYSFVFGKGDSVSQDIRIADNLIEDLQLEVDHSQRVVIERNTVKRAVRTTGIGIFSIGDNALAEDYLIQNNTVIDPLGMGITVEIDPPTTNHSIFRRITIAGNEIIRVQTSGYGVLIGTPDHSKKSTGNVFEDIVIKNNRLRFGPQTPRFEQGIFANSAPTAGIVFQRVTVSGNSLDNEGPKHRGYAIDLRQVQNSIVADNDVKGAANGISLRGQLQANEVRNNRVAVSNVAFAMEDSLGDNRGKQNQVVGAPVAAWKLSGMKASDVIQR